jgi:competence protein ComEC
MEYRNRFSLELAPLLPVAASMAVGIVVGQRVGYWTVAVGVGGLMAALTLLLRHWPRLQTAGVVLCTLAVGWALGAHAVQQVGHEKQTEQRLGGVLQRVDQTKARFLVWRQQLLDEYREWGMTDDVYAVAAAMTLGDKSALDKKIKERYSRAGASHILALSGMHLMVIYSVVTLILGWGRRRLVSQTLIVLSIWAFALLTGLSPSVTRASWMITAYALLSLGYRQRMSLNTLCFVAIVMWVIDPLALNDVSFQLSFAAVLAIVLLNPLFYGLIAPDVLQRHRCWRALWGLTTVSLSAQLGTAPLVAYHFGRVATWFLLTNYIVIPMATVALYLALASIIGGLTGVGTAIPVLLLTTFIRWMNSLLAWVAQLPGSSIEGLHPSVVQTLLMYVLIGCGGVLLSLRCPTVGRNG